MHAPCPPATLDDKSRASRFEPVRRVAALPFYLPLLVALVLVGFRESMTAPYLTLFGIENAHLGPLALGVFLTVRAAGAIVFCMLFGFWFDRAPSVVPLLLSLSAGVLGFALLATTTDFSALLVIAALPLGISAAAFPLIFTLAKANTAAADPITADRGTAILRASFSAAWAIGPAIGALVVGRHGFTGLFWVSAAFSLLAMVPLAVSRVHVPRRGKGASPIADVRRAPGAVLFAGASLAAFSMAVGVGAVALPIVLTIDLPGTKGDVGFAYGLCALLEVPVMLAIAAWPRVFFGFRGMAAGMVALAVYFLVVVFAPSVDTIVASQALRAVSIGLVGCLGISYLQDMMPNRAGAAAALYANTSQVGNLLAGLVAGAWATAFGYHALFWAGAGTSLAGLAFLMAGRRADA